MATCRPQSGELIQAALRPMMAEETKAAEDWPELHLEPASWIEGDQVWVLELQPCDPPYAGGELEETHQLVSNTEDPGSLGQSRTSSVKGAVDPGCQPRSGEAPLQTKGTYGSDGEECSQSLKLTTEQSTHTQNVHIGDQYGEVFQSPPDLAPLLQSTEKTAGQEESQTVSCSRSTLAPIALPLQTENMFADSSKTISLKQMQTEQSAPTQNPCICNQCGKTFLWLSELVQHQLAHSEGEMAKPGQCQSKIPSHDPRAPVLLQDKENLLANSYQETFCQKSTLGVDQSTHTKYLYICEHCGKGYQWRSDFARHQRVHHDRKATKQRGRPSEASPLVSASLPLQEENVFVSPESTFRPKVKPSTDQNSCMKKQSICDQCGKRCRKQYDLVLHYQREHPSREVERTDQNTLTKDLHICDECGKGYLWRSDLYRHRRINHGRKAGKRRERQSEAGPLVPVGLPVSPVSALRSKSGLKTDRTSHINRLHICDQCGMGYQWLSHLARHRSVDHGIKAGKQRAHSSKASPLVSAPLQEEETFVSPERPKSKPVTECTSQSAQAKNRCICRRCGKGFRYPSDLARHQLPCFRRKATRQIKRQSEASPPVSVTQAKATFTAPEFTFTPKTKLTADQSMQTPNQHICRHCGKGYWWPSDLARHERAQHGRTTAQQRTCQSEAGPLVPVPLPLQEEDAMDSPESIVRPESNPTADQSTCTQTQHICVQGGKGCPNSCDLAQHNQCHRCGEKASVHGRRQSDSYSCTALARMSLTLQAENTVSGPCEAASQKSMMMADQSTRTRSLPICGQGGKASQCPSDLLHHHQCIRSVEKAAVQHRCDHHYGKSFQCPPGHASCPSIHYGEQATTVQRPYQSEAHSPSPLALVPLQTKDVFANSPAVFSPEAGLLADQSTHAATPRICGPNGSGFWWPSGPAQHPYVRCEGKAAGWAPFGSKGRRPSHWVSHPLQAENIAANPCRTFFPNSQLMTEQSPNLHTCSHCGNPCQWIPPLDRHQCEHSGAELARQGYCPPAAWRPSPGLSIPLPLQEASSEHIRDRSIETQDLQICNHPGNCFQWPSGLAQHPCVHSWEGDAGGGGCQSKVGDTSPSTSVNMFVQVVSQFADGQKAINPQLKPVTGPCANSKGPSLCGQYGEGFQWLSGLTHSRERPYSCAVCGSQFTRRVQLVKHQKVHKETFDSDEEDSGQDQSGSGEEDTPTEQEQWLPPQGAEELCEPFASPIAYDRDESPTGVGSSPEPPPPNSIWEIGVSGHPYVISLGQPCECGNCGSCDRGTVDMQRTELASFGVDDTASSDWTSPVGFQDASTPVPPTAAWGADDKAEDVLRKEGPPASPTISDAASENLEESFSLSTEEDSELETDDKPYACPKCPKQFKTTSALKRHLAIHQKKKPHRCKTCGMCFAHRSYLAKHLRRHTR